MVVWEDTELQFTNAEEFNTEARLRSIHEMRNACRTMRVRMSDPGYTERHDRDQLLTMYYEAVRTYIYEIGPYVREVDGQLPTSMWRESEFGVVRLPMPRTVSERKAKLRNVSDDIRVYAQNQFQVSGFKGFIEVGSPIMVEWTIDATKGMRHDQHTHLHAHGMPMEISDMGLRRANQFLFTMGVDMNISHRDWMPPDDYEGL
jgi:hypothetical protein